jgi:hypothetical protein
MNFCKEKHKKKAKMEIKCFCNTEKNEKKNLQIESKFLEDLELKIALN